MLVDQADTVVIHSGNIINSYSLKKRVGQKSSDELADSIEKTFTSWKESVGPESMTIPEPIHTLNITNDALTWSHTEERRSNLKISAKIFLSEVEPQLVRNAVENVCKTLGVRDIDSAVLSFPDTIPGAYIEDSFAKALNVWHEMEVMTDEGLVKHIGVTDFDKTAMQDLYRCASVKPTIDQIKTGHDFNVPDDLIKLSEEYDIELLSHDDAADMLPEKSFQAIMEDNFPNCTSASEWLPSYAVRYSAIARCRGIVRSKGYIVEAGKRLSNGYYTVTSGGEGYID